MTWQRSIPEFHAWAAGAFDAGGHIGESRVSLSTADKAITDDLQRFFGGQTRTETTVMRQPRYTWSTTEVDRFLRAIIPFLHEDRQALARKIILDIHSKE